jgi:hypothetical protein
LFFEFYKPTGYKDYVDDNKNIENIKFYTAEKYAINNTYHIKSREIQLSLSSLFKWEVFNILYATLIYIFMIKIKNIL